MLGISLLWKTPSRGISVHLDLLVTLLNRENFMENQQFEISNANYYMAHEDDCNNRTIHGNRSFISIAELLSHRPRFVDTNGEFQIEVRVSNIRTCFENDFTICSRIMNENGNSSGSNEGSFDYEAMEVKSETFVYGGFAWEAIVSPQPQLLAASWASTASLKTSSKRKTLKQFSQSTEDSNKTTDLDNLGINIVLIRKSAKIFSSSKFPNNSNGTSNGKYGSSIDVVTSQRSDELLARLAYKVRNYCFNL